MSAKRESYVKAQDTLPQTMLRWNLYGAGLENFGVDGKPEVMPLPEPGPDQLLLRTDAIGICFSDVKVVKLGPDHPRLTGRDMKTKPVVLGHEAHVTVVKVGSQLTERFQPGQRFIVQADLFVNGVSMAYGYVLEGAMTQYGLVGPEVTDGDDGCYLLPVKDSTGYVEAALVEPWACVVDSYDQKRRTTIKPGGSLLVIQGSHPSHAEYTLGALKDTDHRPAQITAVSCGGQLRAELMDWKAQGSSVTEAGSITDLSGAFDDIVVVGDISAELMEAAAAMLANHGVFWAARTTPVERHLSLDLGRMHYDQLWFTGTHGNDIAAAAEPALMSDIKPGSSVWIVGAGGPMGQMHLQRALQLPDPPAMVIGTDVDAARLQAARERYESIAAARGICFEILNPKEMSPEAFDTKLMTWTGGKGFDYIACMVPVAPLVTASARLLAENGVINLFAGLARGTMGDVDYNAVCDRGARYFGSSGSSIDSIATTLRLMEAGQLQTRASLAAIGGMRAMREGLKGVMENRFAGKTVILPALVDMPLCTLEDLKERYPSVYAKLEDGRFWTTEAEQELLDLLLP